MAIFSLWFQPSVGLFKVLKGSGYRNLNNTYNHSVIHLWTRSANASSLNAYYLYLSGDNSIVNDDLWLYFLYGFSHQLDYSRC
jgi:hypothetical protein